MFADGTDQSDACDSLKKMAYMFIGQYATEERLPVLRFGVSILCTAAALRDAVGRAVGPQLK